MILSFEKQQIIKPISNNNQNRYGQIASEVENLNLKSLLGAAFLYDIQTKAAETTIPEPYKTLLNGGTFLNCDNETISFKGLYYIIAYFNYRQYIGISGYFDTFSGMVTKSRPEGENVSEGTIKRLQTESETIALSEFETVKQYLNENELLFPLWKSCKTKKTFNPKFSTLKKTFN